MSYLKRIQSRRKKRLIFNHRHLRRLEFYQQLISNQIGNLNYYSDMTFDGT